MVAGPAGLYIPLNSREMLWLSETKHNAIELLSWVRSREPLAQGFSKGRGGSKIGEQEQRGQVASLDAGSWENLEVVHR